jgi:hypothetical protein
VELERLIAAYTAAIFAQPFNGAEVDRLCRAVEAEADRVGYTGHARLMAIHTVAEPRVRTIVCTLTMPGSLMRLKRKLTKGEQRSLARMVAAYCERVGVVQ